MTASAADQNSTSGRANDHGMSAAVLTQNLPQPAAGISINFRNLGQRRFGQTEHRIPPHRQHPVVRRNFYPSA